MEMHCADCGCRVDRGVRVEMCGDPACCCRDLPVRGEHPGSDDGGDDRLGATPAAHRTG